ncbi:MAG TPA: lysylphosphatidylglycerol synthase transmembrane domain-containing protein [Polyangia bacterium]|nr:lysylphosphatidylglycerol synthase transmembrane domain-containing protein [Polyangia bacterium]
MLSETPWETRTGAVRSPAGLRGAPRSGSKARWFTWLFGLAVLGAVVLAAAHFSEGRRMLAHARHAQPRWILVAALLQAATYLGQGQIWRVVAWAGHVPVSIATAYRLSIARLFIDQALPSAGLSGTVVMVKSLEQNGIPMPVVMAGVVIDTASCYVTYVIGLLAALVVSLLQHQATKLVLLVAVPFVPFALAITLGFIRLAGRPAGPLARRLSRFRFLRRGLYLLEQADPRLSRNLGLLARACLYQLVVILLDAATIWVLILALGVTPSAGGVFVSFMISTLTRLVGIAPGGLGTYEATSVLTLSMVGVSVPVALSATLLFRGMSFWLPLVPGLWFSRRFMAPHRRRAHASGR